MINYYEDLGISQKASADEIKKAYKRLAIKFHPDRNSEPGAEDKFKTINEAYEVLSDDFKRRQYDASREDWSPYSFDEFINRRPNPFSAQQNKQKPTYTVLVSLEQVYTGADVTVNNTKIRVPAGTRPGAKFYYPSMIVVINIKTHSKFKRSMDHLLVDAEITAFEAMVGIDAELLHIDGKKHKFKIEAGLQPGQIVRLQGLGMPNVETDKPGDLLIKVNITIPRLTNDELYSIIQLQSHSRKILEI